MRLFSSAVLAFLLSFQFSLFAADPDPNLVLAQWDFDNGDLSATLGEPMRFFGDVAASTVFTTMNINGNQAKVMGFPGCSPEQGYVVKHGAPPNGEGTRVNKYTIIMDLMYPSSSSGAYRALFQTGTNEFDADMFVSDFGGIGISGVYEGQMLPDEWHRVAFAFDLTVNTVAKYIDGVPVSPTPQLLDSGKDGRWSLGTEFLLFTDDDFETRPGFVNSIQFRNVYMSAEEIAALGKATSRGLTGPGIPEQFYLSIAKSGSNVIITVNEPGQYQLLKKNNLSDATWTTVGDPNTTGSFTIPANEARAFFQVRRI